jgi:hypothetical protein
MHEKITAAHGYGKGCVEDGLEHILAALIYHSKIRAGK